jgi:polar amino acid transport system ATP-binding protein
VADRIVFMEAGRIIEDAPSAQFFTEPSEERARQFLGQMLQRRTST